MELIQNIACDLYVGKVKHIFVRRAATLTKSLANAITNKSMIFFKLLNYIENRNVLTGTHMMNTMIIRLAVRVSSGESLVR